MSTDFALDLRVQRRQAGYTQDDVAQLLGITQSRVSAFERGQAMPTLPEFTMLSLVFGRSFHSLFAELITDARQRIKGRLAQLPASVRSYVGTFNREANLKRMEARLEANPPEYGAE